MACNCFKSVRKYMHTHLRQAVGNNCAEIEESDFVNHVFYPENSDFCEIVLPYRFRYYRRKKNGEIEKRCTKVDTYVTMKYCPFCGSKFSGESATVPAPKTRPSPR